MGIQRSRQSKSHRKTGRHKHVNSNEKRQTRNDIRPYRPQQNKQNTCLQQKHSTQKNNRRNHERLPQRLARHTRRRTTLRRTDRAKIRYRRPRRRQPLRHGRTRLLPIRPRQRQTRNGELRRIRHKLRRHSKLVHGPRTNTVIQQQLARRKLRRNT